MSLVIVDNDGRTSSSSPTSNTFAIRHRNYYGYTITAEEYAMKGALSAHGPFGNYMPSTVFG
jgi:hypothetical protein